MLITDRKELQNYTAKNRVWQGIPSIEVTKKGRIFSTFYSGGIKEEIGNYCLLLKSEDGENFEDPIAVAYKEGYRCYDPCVWIDPLGRLWFWWSIAMDHAVYAVICDEPDAEELVWSEPFIIGYDVLMNKPIVLTTGEWLFPVAAWDYGVRSLPSEFDTKTKERGSFAYRTVDNGKTFEKIGVADVPKRSFDEHMILELKDGRLAMYVRTTYGIGVSYSFDRGKTWTPGVDSGLGGPCSRFHIRRLKSGRLLLVNHIHFQGRNNLAAMLSEDEGKTWKYHLMLDERKDVSYPDVTEAEDGYLYITYDRERGAFYDSLSWDEVYSSAREILYAKIKEEDMMSGTLLDEGSKLRCIISKLGKYENEKEIPFCEKRRYSDEEVAEILYARTPDEIVNQIFNFYPVSCVDMQKLERNKLDGLIENVEKEVPDKKSAIKELIGYIKTIAVGEPSGFSMVEKIQNVILKYPDRELSVKEIAEEVGVSQYYMLHLFKKTTGMTVTDFKLGVKMTRAKRLLINSEKSMTEIAMECGFCDSSYFSKVFLKTEGVSPTNYRKLLKNNAVSVKDQTSEATGAEENPDTCLYEMLPHMQFLKDVNPEKLEKSECVKHYEVAYPSEDFGFLHEAAIIEYHGTLFAAWYNCKRLELKGRTPIRYRTSKDGGKTWGAIKTVAEDVDGNILYCPPVFGITDDKLYMMLNQMVMADHMHSMDLYLYDEEKECFEELWSRPIPFKLNTNVMELSNGKLMLPGRIAKLDGFPNTPAVMLSDSGKMDAEWRLVNIQKDGNLPDGSKLVHPEISAIAENEKIYMFCRNDARNVPLVYLSVDHGEHWSGPYAHDIPLSDSKIYVGTLSDGRNYVIGNLYPERTRLAIFFSEPNEMRFTKGILLQDGFSEEFGYGSAWHYPAAFESDGKLYIIYTVNVNSKINRGAILSIIDLDKII